MKLKKRFFMTATIIATLTSFLAQSADIYVDGTVTGGDGTTWGTAYSKLQDALTDVVDGNGDVIHIATGTYTPAGATPAVGDKYVIDKSVSILGGYPSGGGTRDPRNEQTIISGNLDGGTTYSQSLFVASKIYQADGLVFRNSHNEGNSTNTSTLVFNAGSETSVISNSIIEQNKHKWGSVVSVLTGTANQSNPIVFNNCLIQNNGGYASEISAGSTTHGGVVFDATGGLLFNNCTLYHNTADNGAIFHGQANEVFSITFNSCLIKNDNNENLFMRNSGSGRATVTFLNTVFDGIGNFEERSMSVGSVAFNCLLSDASANTTNIETNKVIFSSALELGGLSNNGGVTDTFNYGITSSIIDSGITVLEDADNGNLYYESTYNDGATAKSLNDDAAYTLIGARNVFTPATDSTGSARTQGVATFHQGAAAPLLNPAIYESSTCSQVADDLFLTGVAETRAIINLQIEMSGLTVPFNLTDLEITTSGTNSVDHLKIYSTGTTTTFDPGTATLLHDDSSPSDGTQSVDLTNEQTLVTGTNYIWLVYDISAAATIGNVLDISCSQITISNDSGATSDSYTPTVTDPDGSLYVAKALVNCGFEPADNFPEAQRSDPMLDTIDSLGNSWTFGTNAGHWDGFGSMPDNSQHLQFNPAVVESFWQVELASPPTQHVKGRVSFDTAEGTGSTDIYFQLEGLSTLGWLPIGDSIRHTGINPYQTFEFDIADMSLFSQYRLVFSDRAATSRVHFDNIRIMEGGLSDPQVYVSSTTNQPTSGLVPEQSVSDELVIGLAIVAAGGGNPESLTDFSLDVTGASRVTGVTVYATATSDTFTTNNEIYSGEVVDGVNTINVTDTALIDGTNYFWVTYDISGSIASEEVLDAACTTFTLSSAGAQTPAIGVDGQLLVAPTYPVLKMSYETTGAYGTPSTRAAGVVYTYGFEEDYLTQDLDVDSNLDFVNGDSSIPAGITSGTVVVADDEILRMDSGTSIWRTHGFHTGNSAYTFQLKVKVGTPDGNALYNGVLGFVGSDTDDADGSRFIISNDHIQLGDKVVNFNDDTTNFYYYRFAYEPSGSNDGRGDISIYRNSSLIGFYPNRIGTVASGGLDWVGDWGGGLNGGFELDAFSLTTGTHAPIPGLSPVTGIVIVQDGLELTWRVDEEIDVKEYQVVDIITGEIITVVVASGLETYSVTLPEGVTAKLVVVDNSGLIQTFYPENGNLRSVAYDLSKGWNLITITTEDASLSKLKKVTSGDLWAWDGSKYQVITEPQPTQGVWVYASKATQVTVTGRKSDAEMEISTGWNLVGPVENSSIPQNAALVYGWNDIYENIIIDHGILLQGVGYWIFSF